MTVQVNSCHLMGTLKHEPTRINTKKGILKADFVLTISRENRLEKDEVRCIAFGDTARNILQNIHRDSLVYVTGRNQSRTYMYHDTPIMVNEVLVQHIVFLPDMVQRKEKVK